LLVQADKRPEMPNVRHLQNAPKIEAIIDLRVKTRPGLRAEEFTGLKPELADRFPKVEERRGVEARFEVRAGTSAPPVVQDRGFYGYFLKSDDEKTIAQFRVDGFRFNRLRPYTNWEQLFPIALDLWRVYARVAKPEQVIRLAVRYINHIPLPLGTGPFEYYLRAAPVIPPELPQYVSSFLTRVTIQDPETKMAAHIAQALDPRADARRLTIILDIDAYKEVQYSHDNPSVESTFLELRTFKKLIFLVA
jgi:uncharacterized protein (TIGR04255 family)